VWGRSQLVGLTAHGKVEVDAEARRVDVLAPAVEELVQVVEVVLASAATGPSGSGGFTVGQTRMPAIVPADSEDDVSAAFVEGLPEVTSAGADIEVWVPAVAIWSTTAFFNGQLHESLFTASTYGVLSARTFLHGKRGEKNGGNAELIAIGLEQPDEGSTVTERTSWLGNGPTELDCVEVGDGKIGRVPSSAVDTTVQPADGTVGTRCCGNLACRTRVTTISGKAICACTTRGRCVGRGSGSGCCRGSSRRGGSGGSTGTSSDVRYGWTSSASP